MTLPILLKLLVKLNLQGLQKGSLWAFQACAFSHSATSPHSIDNRLELGNLALPGKTVKSNCQSQTINNTRFFWLPQGFYPMASSSYFLPLLLLFFVLEICRSGWSPDTRLKEKTTANMTMAPRTAIIILLFQGEGSGAFGKGWTGGFGFFFSSI